MRDASVMSPLSSVISCSTPCNADRSVRGRTSPKTCTHGHDVTNSRARWLPIMPLIPVMKTRHRGASSWQRPTQIDLAWRECKAASYKAGGSIASVRSVVSAIYHSLALCCGGARRPGLLVTEASGHGRIRELGALPSTTLLTTCPYVNPTSEGERYVAGSVGVWLMEAESYLLHWFQNGVGRVETKGVLTGRGSTANTQQPSRRKSACMCMHVHVADIYM